MAGPSKEMGYQNIGEMKTEKKILEAKRVQAVVESQSGGNEDEGETQSKLSVHEEATWEYMILHPKLKKNTYQQRIGEYM